MRSGFAGILTVFCIESVNVRGQCPTSNAAVPVSRAGSAGVVAHEPREKANALMNKATAIRDKLGRTKVLLGRWPKTGQAAYDGNVLLEISFRTHFMFPSRRRAPWRKNKRITLTA